MERTSLDYARNDTEHMEVRVISSTSRKDTDVPERRSLSQYRLLVDEHADEEAL